MQSAVSAVIAFARATTPVVGVSDTMLSCEFTRVPATGG